MISTNGRVHDAENRANRKSTDAKLFWNGRSQAVRLPKEFRFVGDAR